MQLKDADPLAVIQEMTNLAGRCGYTKLFARIDGRCKPSFVNAGFYQEAAIPIGAKRSGQIVFMAKYLARQRAQEYHPEKVDEILTAAQSAPRNGNGSLKSEIDCDNFRCSQADIDEMCALYQTAFSSYPFPIKECDYLAQTMEKNCRYYCIRRKNRMVALAAAEMDLDTMSVEMTDFATAPAWRRKGLATRLLAVMEADMIEAGLTTAYTIARALSRGMNKTFAAAGYTFAGTLTNNTHIAGSIQSMNVWYKSLTTF
jgi:putative beta-lysine N-acetyltransferase